MSIKKIIALVLTAAVVIIALGAISSFAGKETERISPWKFSRGALDENGEYVASKQSLYTEEPFGCYGMTITVDFEAKLTYDVYFYDKEGNFESKETGLIGKYEYTELPEFPRFARIVIYPTAPEGEKDFEIKFWETYSYADSLDIQVAKKQESVYLGVYTIPFTTLTKNTGNLNLNGSKLELSGETGFTTYTDILLEDSQGHDFKYLFLTLETSYSSPISIYGTNINGTSFLLQEVYANSGGKTLEFDLSSYSNIESISLCSLYSYTFEIQGYY